MKGAHLLPMNPPERGGCRLPSFLTSVVPSNVQTLPDAGKQQGEFAMITIDLTPEERAMLVEMLEIRLADLRMEISDTDSLDFRNELKKRKEALAKLIDALKGE